MALVNHAGIFQDVYRSILNKYPAPPHIAGSHPSPAVLDYYERQDHLRKHISLMASIATDEVVRLYKEGKLDG